MSKVKKLAFVIHSLQPGGMERVMSELVSCLAADPSLEIHLVLYGIRPEVFYTVDPRVTIHQPAEAFDPSRKLQSTLKRIRFLRTTIKQIDPVAVLTFGEYWNSMVLFSLLFTGYKVYVSDRCQPDKKMSFVHGTLRKLLYPKAHGIIAQTEKARGIFSSTLRHRNIRVIGNPIRFIPPSEAVRENVVLSVGRLIASKHHDQLIRIFSRVAKENWKLVIVGGDALKQNNMLRLANLVKELGVEGRVVLAGNRQDVDSFYLTSKIFAFTSSSEGFPNVIGEAMSAGLPVVAYDCVAGPSDMIRDGGNGYLIELFNEKAFEEKLALLMEDDALRTKMGEEARTFINRYSVHSISHAYKDFLLGN